MKDFNPSDIHMWISKSEAVGGYYKKDGKLIINTLLYDITILDYEDNDIFMPSCGAFLKTDRGFHFLFPPTINRAHKLQDANYLRICTDRGHWSQFIQSKITGEKRILISNNPQWDNFVFKWNNMVQEAINKG